jgi:DNA-binding MarR family transcriptional regulator
MPRSRDPKAPESDHRCLPRDSVDALQASWRSIRPDLDFDPVGVCARLTRVRTHIDAEVERALSAHGLGSPTFAVLITLARVGAGAGVSQRRLMDELGLTSGTISLRMNRLVQEGLIERRRDPESRRNTLITLTDKGRELFQRAVPAHLANERRLLAALTDSERETLATLLRKLLVEFEGSLPPADAPLRLGLTLAPAHVAISLRESVGLPALPALLVRAVTEEGPAADAGIRIGDVLVSAGRRDLRSIAALYSAIDDQAGTGRLQVTLVRGAGRHRVTIRLAEEPVVDGALAATPGRTGTGDHHV